MNYAKFISTFPDIPVLIDTWWNVNTLVDAFNVMVYRVLIDTWWNVNINFSGKMAQMSTF